MFRVIAHHSESTYAPKFKLISLISLASRSQIKCSLLRSVCDGDLIYLMLIATFFHPYLGLFWSHAGSRVHASAERRRQALDSTLDAVPSMRDVDFALLVSDYFSLAS